MQSGAKGALLVLAVVCTVCSASLANPHSSVRHANQRRLLANSLESGGFRASMDDWEEALGGIPRGSVSVTPDETVDRLSAQIAQNPRNAALLAKRATRNYEVGNYQEALADFDRAVSVQPRNCGYLFLRAVAKRKLGRFDGALADVTAASKLGAAQKDCLRLKVSICAGAKRYPQAIAELQKLITIEPQSTENYFYKSDMEVMAGRGSDAIRDCQQAMRVDPSQEINQEAWVRIRKIETKTYD